MPKSKKPDLTVLVVTDEDVVRTLLERALKLFGMAGRSTRACASFSRAAIPPHTVEELLGRGAVAFVAKPFESLSELETVLREAARKCGR